MPTKKSRNPQDATRSRDVAPLRRRIEKLETAVKELQRFAGGATKVLFPPLPRSIPRRALAEKRK